MSGSWEDMQRRLARRAGLVSEFEDRPRLLAAADEMTPSAWERNVDHWPDVARTSSRLRPPMGAMLESSGHSEEDDSMAAELEEMIPWLTEALGEDFVAEHFPLTPSAGASAAPSPSPSIPTPRPRTPRQSPMDSLGSRTPPSVYPARGRQLGARQQLENALIEIEKMQPGKEPSHLAGSGLEGEVREFSPRTIARQQYDLYSDPFSAADEFTLARRKARRKTAAMQKMSNKDKPGITSLSTEQQQSPAPGKLAQHAGSLPAENMQQLTARDKVLDRLEYLQACREIMGDERFSNERQRFEMHSQLRSAAKYSIEEKPQDVRSAFSVQVRGLKDDDDENTERKVDKAATRHSSLLRPATAPEPPSAVAASLGGGLNDSFPPRPSTSDVTDRDRLQQNQPDLAKRAFHFASKCKDNRVAMPCLGTFSLATPQATPRQRNASPEKPTELSVSHWSLGDKPLLALAASPMKDCLASVEEGGLSGNRITNKGVTALVANLGNTTSLDLSENRFDSRCASSLVGFLKSNQSLRDLILSRNRLSDESVAALCRKMGESCPALTYVGLSDVQFGVGVFTGPALGMLLETAPRLRGLDISFNMLQGPGAIAFLDGLNNTRVEHLDVSWNCLGQGSKSTNVAEQLALVLRDNDSLLHLDISFNRFKSQDAAVLARGLRANRTLWGIHLEGNSAVLDVDSFMHMVSDEVPASPELPLSARAASKKKQGKAGKKAKSARGKDSTEAEAESSAFGLTPEEMEVRARALQNHISAMDESSAWQVKWEAEERHRKTRGQLSENFGFEGTAKEKDSGKKYGIVLPDVLEPDLFGETMDPRKQDSWLQTLSRKVKPDMCQALRTLSNSARGKHNRTDGLRQDGRCWLCGAWVEVVIEIDADSLLDDAALKPEAAVCVLLSIDNFSRPTPLLPCSATGEKTVRSWKGSRFLPPTEQDLHMVFQVGNCLKVLEELTVKDLQRPLRLPLWRVGTGVEETSEASHDQILQVNVLNIASLAEKYVAAAAVSSPEEVPKQREAIIWVNRTATMASADAKDAVQQPPHAMLPRQRWPSWSRRTSNSGVKIVAPPHSSPSTR